MPAWAQWVGIVVGTLTIVSVLGATFAKIGRALRQLELADDQARDLKQCREGVAWMAPLLKMLLDRAGISDARMRRRFEQIEESSRRRSEADSAPPPHVVPAVDDRRPLRWTPEAPPAVVSPRLPTPNPQAPPPGLAARRPAPKSSVPRVDEEDEGKGDD